MLISIATAMAMMMATVMAITLATLKVAAELLRMIKDTILNLVILLFIWAYTLALPTLVVCGILFLYEKCNRRLIFWRQG